MEQIGIRDLHQLGSRTLPPSHLRDLKTGEWVRRGEGVVVTERGRPVASLVPYAPDASGRSFRDRRVLPEFDALPSVPGDSVVYVSEDRDRR